MKHLIIKHLKIFPRTNLLWIISGIISIIIVVDHRSKHTHRIFCHGNEIRLSIHNLKITNFLSSKLYQKE